MTRQLSSHSHSDQGGFYTVLIGTDGGARLPYVVFAASDYHAARLVRDETGFMASEKDIEGPYTRV